MSSRCTCTRLDEVGVRHEREQVAAVTRGPVEAERLEEEDELVEHGRRAALELDVEQVLLLPVPVERELHGQLHLRTEPNILFECNTTTIQNCIVCMYTIELNSIIQEVTSLVCLRGHFTSLHFRKQSESN